MSIHLYNSSLQSLNDWKVRTVSFSFVFLTSNIFPDLGAEKILKYLLNEWITGSCTTVFHSHHSSKFRTSYPKNMAHWHTKGLELKESEKWQMPRYLIPRQVIRFSSEVSPYSWGKGALTFKNREGPQELSQRTGLTVSHSLHLACIFLSPSFPSPSSNLTQKQA